MRIAHIGASGNVGSKIVTEALNRGHHVTAIVRNPDKVATKPGLTAKAGNLNDGDALAELLHGHDVVISSVMFSNYQAPQLIDAVRKSGVKRLMVVGGAGSLLLPDGSELIDSPEFPDIYRAEAGAGRDVLLALKKVDDLDWTYISPAAIIAPGERTGKFRVGQDQLMFDEKGESKISQEDFAIAFVNELESGANPKRRISVAY